MEERRRNRNLSHNQVLEKKVRVVVVSLLLLFFVSSMVILIGAIIHGVTNGS